MGNAKKYEFLTYFLQRAHARPDGGCGHLQVPVEGVLRAKGRDLLRQGQLQQASVEGHQLQGTAGRGAGGHVRAQVNGIRYDKKRLVNR